MKQSEREAFLEESKPRFEDEEDVDAGLLHQALENRASELDLLFWPLSFVQLQSINIITKLVLIQAILPRKVLDFQQWKLIICVCPSIPTLRPTMVNHQSNLITGQVIANQSYKSAGAFGSVSGRVRA